MTLLSRALLTAGRWLDRKRQAARRRRGAEPHLLLGERGEDWAHRFIQEMGWTVVARNYRRRSGSGEIDLVAVEGDTIVFIEVKTRSSGAIGDPERAVNLRKERLLGRTAEEYLRFAQIENMAVRFDIVSLVMGGDATKVEYFRDAFYPVRSPHPHQ